MITELVLVRIGPKEYIIYAYHGLIIVVTCISCFLKIITEDIDECSQNITGCNQNCTNTNGTYFCSCYPGFEILNDNRTCVGKFDANDTSICCYLQCVMYFVLLFEDIDECARNISGCNQNCTNTNGSYFCSCYPGYEIENDNKTCIGKDFNYCLHV